MTQKKGTNRSMQSTNGFMIQKRIEDEPGGEEEEKTLKKPSHWFWLEFV